MTPTRVLMFASLANAAFWNLTSYYMMSTTYSTLTATIASTPVAHTLTRTHVTQLVDFAPAPTNTIITSSTYSSGDVNILYATITYDAAIPTSLYYDSDEQYSSRLATADTDFDSAVTNYMYTETYLAPTDCAATFSPTVTVGISAYVDDEVTPYITPTALSTSTDYETYTFYRNGRTTVETSLTVWAWAPRSEFPPLATATDYFYTEYIGACRMPTRTSGYGYTLLDAATATATATESDMTLTGTANSAKETREALILYVEASNEISGLRSFIFWRICSHTETSVLQAAKDASDVNQLCYEMRPWVLTVCIVFPILIVGGFVESFFWFDRAMRGEKSLKLGTICWILACVWFVFFTRISPAERGKSRDDKAVKHWNGLSLMEKLRRWSAHGFSRTKQKDSVLGRDA